MKAPLTAGPAAPAIKHLAVVAAAGLLPAADLPAQLQTVPPDLSPGDQYRLVFVTSATRDATAQDIGTYDAFVAEAAAGAPLLEVLDTTWKCIGSAGNRATGVYRDAIAHTLTRPTDPSLPIYRLDGLRVAAGNADLWDGALVHPIAIDQSGHPHQGKVWSGTRHTGVRSGDWFLGDTGGGWVYYGLSSAMTSAWIENLGEQKTTPCSLYAISGVLTVPLPATELLGFQWEGSVGVIDQAARTVALTVPYGTDLTTLAPTCIVSPGATVSPASATPRDFSDSQAVPLDYTVSAEGVEPTVYSVTVLEGPPSAQCAVTSLRWGDYAGRIHDDQVTLVVPSGTDLTALAPAYTVSPFAAGDPQYPSGTARDFTAPQTYTVTAQDQTTTGAFTVTVLEVAVIVPRGLAAGAPYRLLFATSTAQPCSSTGIADYNALVDATAAAAPDLAALDTTWRCLGSTATVNADANTLTRAQDPDAPIFNLGGVPVATGNADLWDGALANPVHFTERGATPALLPVWTGTNWNGVRSGDWFLADGGWVRYGFPHTTDSTWVAALGPPYEDLHRSDPRPYYAISDILTVPEGGSPACNLLGFQWGDTAGVIDQATGAVTLTVPYNTELTTLAPACLPSAFATVSPASGQPVDFSEAQTTPVQYTVTAEDGTATRTYGVRIDLIPPRTGCELLSFEWDGTSAVIEDTTVTVTVPVGTDLTSVAPTFTLSPGATCDRVSGAPYDFRSPVHYIVTAEDGVHSNDYVVTIATPFSQWIAGFDFSAFPDPDLTESGDPDGDGRTNLVEYAYGLDPAFAEDFTHALTRERWSGLAGTNVADLTGVRERFLGPPDDWALTPGIDESAQGADYGSRFRGWITAPQTGVYYFWICADDEAELWLADGSITRTVDGQEIALTNRYGKQRIASVLDPRIGTHFTQPHDFDRLPRQQSEAILLQAGHHYYFEVLHKQGGGGDHVSVAWQVPGSLRQIIPAQAFHGDDTQPDDLDDDNLPDPWEAATGLDPADNGLGDPGDGQYGDHDADGLTNLEEYQLGTDPLNTDTDGDGLSDKDERDYYHSDPLVSNQLAAGPAVGLPPHEYSSTTGYWSRDASGSLTAADRRGEITYPFTVGSDPQGLLPGVLEVTLSGGAAGAPRPVENLPLIFSVDGRRFATGTLTSHDGASAEVSVLTPWLTAGAHTLGIFHDNFRTARRLRIDSISLRNLGGLDADENQVPDWLDQRLATNNHLTRAPATSLTSPVCIEGVTGHLPGLVLTADGQPITPVESVDSSFYAEIPLSESGPVELRASFQSGALAESRAITWGETDLLTCGELTVRQGDRLRLTGREDWGLPFDLNSLDVTIDLDGGQTHYAFKASTSVPHLFDTPGDHQIEVEVRHDANRIATASVTVHVRAASFGPPLSAGAYYPKQWQPADLGHELVIQPDSRLSWAETTPGPDSPRSFLVTPWDAGTRHVLARLPEEITGAPGAIVARGTVNAFQLAYLDLTSDTEVVHVYSDGTFLVRGSVVAVNLPPDIYIRLKTLFQGTVFSNGSDTLWLSAADFDQNGIAHIYFEWQGVGSPYVCTYVDLFTTEPPPEP